MSKLTSEHAGEIAAVAAVSDDEIDYSDAPSLADWSNAVVGKFYRPTLVTITVEIDAALVEWLKDGGESCQPKLDRVLQRAKKFEQLGKFEEGRRRLLAMRRPAPGTKGSDDLTPDPSCSPLAARLAALGTEVPESVWQRVDELEGFVRPNAVAE